MTIRRILLAVVLFSLFSACKSGTRVDSLEPDHGNVSGNDSVVILGGGFKPGMTVYFGKRQADKVVIEAPGRIRVKTPSGPAGQVDVVIVDPDGKSFGLQNGFSYHSGDK
jgi:hypothetical protein